MYDVSGKFFTKPDALFLPTRNSEDVVELMENLYSEIDVSPEEVEYVEANATGNLNLLVINCLVNVVCICMFIPVQFPFFPLLCIFYY